MYDRRFARLMGRRNARGTPASRGGGITIESLLISGNLSLPGTVAIRDLDAQILAVYGSACQGLWLARESDVTLATGKVTDWADVSGNGRTLSQATDAARPTWTTSGLNSLPALQFSGAQALASSAFSLNAFTAFAFSVVFVDTIGTGATVVAHGNGRNGGTSFRIFVNATAGNLRSHANNGVGQASAESSTSFGMATAAVVSATWDRALATNEAEIRHNVTNVTSGRVSNTDLAAGLGSQMITVGAADNLTVPLTGHIAAVVLGAWTTAVPTADVASVETILKTAWAT